MRACEWWGGDPALTHSTQVLTKTPKISVFAFRFHRKLMLGTGTVGESRVCVEKCIYANLQAHAFRAFQK